MIYARFRELTLLAAFTAPVRVSSVRMAMTRPSRGQGGTGGMGEVYSALDLPNGYEALQLLCQFCTKII